MKTKQISKQTNKHIYLYIFNEKKKHEKEKPRLVLIAD